MIDKAVVSIRAGDGGDGSIHFRREKFIPKGGPDGGDGGDGGDVYVEVDPQVNTLRQFAYRQKFEAEDGKKGGEKRSSGKAGQDLTIKVPVGTLLRLKATEGQASKEIDLDQKGIRMLIARGGKGGRGNWHFKSSRNTTPWEAEPGEDGERFEVEMELKLLADVGLIGLPSVGKSTLLSVITSARPKIADYEFTTLEPNLGVIPTLSRSSGTMLGARELVIADIPGLIEGASEGRGLGDDFLRHVERTKMLVHIAALSNEQFLLTDGLKIAKILWGNYVIVRKELEKFNRALLEKREIVVLNKIDLMDKVVVDRVIKFFARKGIKVIPVSCGTTEGVEKLVAVIFEEFAKGDKDNDKD